MLPHIKLIECPRDAMQGIKTFIPTNVKIKYLNILLKAGFDTIDIGSFVSPAAIPQLKDTADVLNAIDTSGSVSKLLVIVANRRGIDEAVKFSGVTYLGYPFSISETFQQRNTNASIAEAVEQVKYLKEQCDKHQKIPVVYISMGFGNPYGDPWNVDIAASWAEKLAGIGIPIISLSDTIGIADTASLSYLFSGLIPAFPHIEFGAHLHTVPYNWQPKIEAAYASGCRRFDGAIKGYGGCPMAADDLTGNMPTENLIAFFREHLSQFRHDLLPEILKEADEVFLTH